MTTNHDHKSTVHAIIKRYSEVPSTDENKLIAVIGINYVIKKSSPTMVVNAIIEWTRNRYKEEEHNEKEEELFLLACVIYSTYLVDDSSESKTKKESEPEYSRIESMYCKKLLRDKSLLCNSDLSKSPAAEPQYSEPIINPPHNRSSTERSKKVKSYYIEPSVNVKSYYTESSVKVEPHYSKPSVKVESPVTVQPSPMIEPYLEPSTMIEPSTPVEPYIEPSEPYIEPSATANLYSESLTPVEPYIEPSAMANLSISTEEPHYSKPSTRIKVYSKPSTEVLYSRSLSDQERSQLCYNEPSTAVEPQYSEPIINSCDNKSPTGVDPQYSGLLMTLSHRAKPPLPKARSLHSKSLAKPPLPKKRSSHSKSLTKSPLLAMKSHCSKSLMGSSPPKVNSLVLGPKRSNPVPIVAKRSNPSLESSYSSLSPETKSPESPYSSLVETQRGRSLKNILKYNKKHTN